MNSYSPTFALLIFALMTVAVYLLFRPVNGWFWILKNNLKSSEKTIIEDILKQLYRMENSGLIADSNALTNALKMKDRLIIDAIHRMAVTELVELEGEQVRLTREGREYALRIIRVHRLWEKYLAEKTGFDKTEWHGRAEEMEHQLSGAEADKLALQLGYPIFDPHGDPIPTVKGQIKKLDGIPLSSLEEDSVGRIVHIEDEPDAIYRQILAENIHIGSRLRVVERNNEKVVFYSEGEEFVLAPVVASNITVLLEENQPEEAQESAVRLSSLKEDETARVAGISRECRGENRRRLLDLGFVKGAEISIDLRSPMKNPVAYSIKGTSIALRKDQASKILIRKTD
jgi:DtxR family Mn-dependent transcriptional regulator